MTTNIDKNSKLLIAFSDSNELVFQEIKSEFQHMRYKNLFILMK